MNPFKSGIAVGHWLLRLSIVIYIVFQYIDTLKKFNLKNLDFLVAALMFIFSVLLFIGGFTKKTTLTVITSFAITLILIYISVADFAGFFDPALRIRLLLLSIAFYFFTKGNKG